MTGGGGCPTWNTKKGAVALSLNSSEKSGTTISALQGPRCSQSWAPRAPGTSMWRLVSLRPGSPR